ncbi:MAG: hypothetical protein CMB80_05460 [Flammeovirgaceae bacterium]|nr:hypothetical protein [Flammeovirgaceae bacterium]|tara:strand:+ start:2541 stop:2927 length:387 start_codon:yes stop_codon:yes gene_type:complete
MSDEEIEEKYGKPPSFPEKGQPFELEEQIRFFRELFQWVQSNRTAAITNDPDFNSCITSRLVVLGQALAMEARDGKLPPYEGLNAIVEQANSALNVRTIDEIGKFYDTFPPKVMLFFAETFGTEVIEC